MEHILKYLNDNNFEEIVKIKNYNTYITDGNNILHLLAIRGNEKGLDYFLSSNPELNETNSMGHNIIHLLFKNGWDDIAKKYYTKYTELLYTHDKDLKLPISYSVDRYNTFIDCFKYMKKHDDTNISEILNNVSNYNDNIIINIIKLSDDDKYYKFIVDNLDLIDFDKPKINPVLIYCIINDKNKLSTFFIEHKKGISSKNYMYLLPINIACTKNNINIVKLLLDNNKDINYGGVNNIYLPFNIAINNDFLELADLLSEYITKYNTIDKFKNTYMHYISDNLLKYVQTKQPKKEKKIKHILKKIIFKSDIDLKNIDGVTSRQLLLKYIKMKRKDADLAKTINSIDIQKSTDNNNNIDIIKNNKKHSYGLFNSDTVHSMIYYIYLLNKYDNLGIPFYKFNEEEYKTAIMELSMQNIIYNEHYKVIYDILKTIHLFSYPLLPSVILWKDRNLNYINKDLFDIIKSLSKNKRFILIKVILVVAGQYTHANIILIDVEDSSIRRFEPYGIDDTNDEKHLDDLILEKVSKVLDKKMTYYRPSDYLDKFKFQLVSNDNSYDYRKLNDPGGYCLAWCIWYIELKINNSNLSEEDLIKYASAKINKYYKNTDNSYLYFIRDYSRKLNDEKDKILKKMNLKNNELYNVKFKQDISYKIFDYIVDFFK